GGLLPTARHFLYASTASPPQNCSVLALGSSPNACPCKCAATVNISSPRFLAFAYRSFAYAAAPSSLAHRFRSSSQLASSQPSKPAPAMKSSHLSSGTSPNCRRTSG